LLDALVYLHERDRQIIHRDIKPHNLKVMTSGRIALLDFGLAKTSVTEHSITNSSNSIFGYTRRYSPPEQISDCGTTPQSDIYALGATLYHLLTGMKPHDSLERAAAIANQDPDPLKPVSEVNPTIDSALSTLIQKAMALTARERFKSAREFREALRSLRRKSLPALEPAGLLTADQARIVPVKKPDGALDPFDSYSILRPEQDVFNLPRGSRRPWLIAALVAIALVVLVSAYPSRVADSIPAMPDSTRATSPRVLTDGLGLHQNKTSPVVTKPSPVKAGMGGVERDSQHKDDPQKRRSAQTTAKPEAAKPPRFSISPE
jgi:serine/threonine protein kinase